MRLTCPHCGTRDQREFSYKGAAAYLKRPEAGSDAAAWDDYLHLRDNPAGLTEELWHHTPCGTWLVAERDTTTHVIGAIRAASEGRQ